jgi:pimeloyl-ACP methyl ester carboxylesterase
MSQSKPTILIIHGAWHHPAYFHTLINALQGDGYDVSCPRLPTCNNAVPPNMTFEDDVKLIRNTATQLVDEGIEVVALLHSYGGMVGTDALHGLSLQSRTSSGLRGGVRRLLYMCAFIPQNGQSLAGIFGGGLPPWLEPKVQFPRDCIENELITLRMTASSTSMILRCTSTAT